MDCYFSMEISGVLNHPRAKCILDESDLSYSASLKSDILYVSGNHSGQVQSAACKLESVSETLVTGDISHIIWLDNTDGMLHKTFSHKWLRNDYT